MKKITSLLLACILTLGMLSSCASIPGNKYRVGICQFEHHEALDKATQGFKDALTEVLGDTVVFDEQIAAGEVSTCAAIVDTFVADKVDLILANATSSLTAAASATTDIPILGTCVTNYCVALDVEDESEIPNNISGTSDHASIEDQAKMICDWMPDAKNVAIILCSSEDNSLYQEKLMTKELSNLKYNVKTFSFTDTMDINNVVNEACEFADLIYIPTDNTSAANIEAISNIVTPLNIPVFTTEEAPCKVCGVATLTIDYYDLGYTTGKMAAEILNGTSKIETLAIQYAPTTKKYNKEVCDRLGLDVPSGYTEIK